MTKHEILPCPFCGREARLSTIGRSWYRVTAEHTDGCILEEHESDCPQTDDQLPLLLRDWNTRSGFTAVDMATAAADGFRDGAASRDVEIEMLRKDAEHGRLLSFCHGAGLTEIIRSNQELLAEVRRLKILAGESVPPLPEEFVGPYPEGPTARIRRNIAAMSKEG